MIEHIINKSVELAKARKIDEAIDMLINATKSHQHYLLHVNLSELYRRKGDHGPSQYHAGIACLINANSISLLCLAAIELDMKCYNKAEQIYNQIIKIEPDNVDARMGLAKIHLKLNVPMWRNLIPSAWNEFEWRFKYPIFDFLSEDRFMAPKWRGQSLKGKTILIYGEQGFGDTIQFVRYYKNLQEKGAHVVIWAFPELASLFKCIQDVTIVTSYYDLPLYDYHISMMSLPIYLNQISDPYIFADPVKVEQWKPLVKNKVGLVYQGNPDLPDDLQRSTTLDVVKPIMDKFDVTLLHKTKEMKDFSDTAAIIENLDFVISIDSAVVHLAGAMGKPVYMINRFNGCWRWGEGQTTSPWYPKLKIYNMKFPNDWDGCIESILRDV